MLHEKAVQPAALALLKRLAKIKIPEPFALGGGTNVALRLGHRVSVDLDFFTDESFDKNNLFKIISKEFSSSELLFEQNQTMLFFINDVRVDFVQYPFPWLLPFETIEDVRLISIKDIIPMKLQAVSNRFSKKDYWDIAFLLNKHSLTEQIDIFKEKFPQIDPGYIIHSLTNFQEAENQPDPDLLINITWEEVKEKLSRAVKKFTKDSL